MRITIEKIRNEEILPILTISLYLMPAFFKTFDIIRRIHSVLMVVVSLLVILMWVSESLNSRKEIRIMGILIVAFYFVVFLSTYINNGDCLRFLLQAIIGIGFCAYISLLFNRFEEERIIVCMIYVLEILVLINLLTIIFFPDGLYTIYDYGDRWKNPGFLLGHRNNALETCIPLIGLQMYLDIIRNRLCSINTWFVIVISLITSILTWSVNEIMCMIFISSTVLVLLIKKRQIVLLDIGILYCGALLTTFILFFVGLNDFFSHIVVDIFHKNSTLAGRFNFWNKSAIYIKNRLFLGYGIEDQAIKYAKIGHPNSSHNYFFDYLYLGGIVLFVLVAVMILVLRGYIKNTNQYIFNRASAFFGTYFILWIATPLHRETIFMMFSMMMLTMCVNWSWYDEVGVT